MNSDPIHAREPHAPLGERTLNLTETTFVRAAPEPPSRGPSPAAKTALEDLRRAHEDGATCTVDRPDRSESMRRGDAGIEVCRLGDALYRARFALQLSSVSSTALEPDRSKWNEHGAIDPGESARQRALSSLACSLRPDQCVRFVHQSVAQEGRGLRYRMQVEGEAAGTSQASATALAVELLDALRACLAVGAEPFGFDGLEMPPATTEWPNELELVPAAITTEPMPAVAMTTSAPEAQCPALLPVVPRQRRTYLDGVVATLTSMQGPARLVIEWRGLQCDARMHEAVARDTASLLGLDSRSVRLVAHGGSGVEASREDVQLTHRALQEWIAEPMGALMRVRLQSTAPLPLAVARMIGAELFLGRPFTVERCESGEGQPQVALSPVTDLRGLVSAGTSVPPLLPAPLTTDAQGVARRFPAVDFESSRSGVLLGHSVGRHGGQEVRFADHARGQHCLVLGQTGSGKTRGVIEAMALQDMARGEGVIHIDLDGDSFDYLHAECPAHRRADIVSLDFTDFEASPGINLLQLQTRRPHVERGFIVDSLVQL